MQIYLVVFDKTAYRLSEKLFQGVASYIDEHFVDFCEKAALEDNLRRSRRPRARQSRICEADEVFDTEVLSSSMPMAAPVAASKRTPFCSLQS